MPYEKTGKETRCIAEEVPFEIPDSWAWVRCGSLFLVNPRNTMSDDALVGFMPMPMLCDGFQNKHSFETKKWGEVKNGFTHFADGDIVIAKITPCFQNRKSAIIAGLPNSCGAGSTELHVLRGLSNCLFMPFFLWLFKTHHFIEEGKKHFSGTAGQQRIGKDFIATYMIPLPPLAEQRRIVAKIEELLPHLDEYDQAETRVKELNAEFPEKLKKSILQWAIQGKLVPQDPNDEPASVLLDRIRAEKAKLVKAGKIKKDKAESVIFRRDNSHYEKINGVERCIDDEIPFEIPDSWAWCRIGTVFNLQAGKNITSREIQTEASPGLFPCFGGNGIRGYVSQKNRSGSFALIGRQGALCGNINFADGDFYATEHAVVVETFADCSTKWSGLFLQALNLNQYATSTAQPGLAVKNINWVLIPLPPLTEQRRIVEFYFSLFSEVRTLTQFSL